MSRDPIAEAIDLKGLRKAKVLPDRSHFVGTFLKVLGKDVVYRDIHEANGLATKVACEIMGTPNGPPLGEGEFVLAHVQVNSRLECVARTTPGRAGTLRSIVGEPQPETHSAP
jgi:hypothetical protein